MQLIDTSSELQIFRYNNGIKLIRPELGNSTQHTISSLFQLPLSVYFIRADGNNENVNEQDAILCGFDSAKNAIGKICFSNFTKASAKITTQNDQTVMRTEKPKISEEDVILKEENNIRPTLSFKLPWYDDENKVIGIFGCSIILGQHPLAQSLSLISKLGLLNTSEQITQYIGIETNNIYLSKRQLSCAKFLLQGLTVKQIAAKLGLSPRTVETYVEIIKNKFQCHNRAELILKLSEYITKHINGT